MIEIPTKAQYTPSLVYPENPFIEALPPQLSAKELYDALYNKPTLPPNISQYTAIDRAALACKNLRSLFIPFDFALDVYRGIYEGLRSTYAGWSQIEMIKQLNLIGRAIEKRDAHMVPDSPTQSQSMALLGNAGCGKTQTVSKILNDLIPQVIIHDTDQYGAAMKGFKQIPWIKVECPQQNTTRGLCLQILQEIDKLLGTNLTLTETKTASNVELLICRFASICIQYGIGILVIDEIQQMIATRSKDPAYSSQVLRFLIELHNKTGISIFCIGTHQAEPFFNREAHLARRTRGPRIKYLENDETFKKLCLVMLDMIPARRNNESEICNMVFKYTNGVIANMQRLMMETAQLVIGTEEETITPGAIEMAAKKIALDGNKRKLIDMGQEPHFLYENGFVSPSSIKAARALNRSKTNGRGRPKKVRDVSDLLVIYTDCKKLGISVEKYLVQHGIAEEVR